MGVRSGLGAGDLNVLRGFGAQVYKLSHGAESGVTRASCEHNFNSLGRHSVV